MQLTWGLGPNPTRGGSAAVTGAAPCKDAHLESPLAACGSEGSTSGQPQGEGDADWASGLSLEGQTMPCCVSEGGEGGAQSFSSDLQVHTEITGTDMDMPPSSGTGASENGIRQCVGFVNATIHFGSGLLLFGEGGLVSRLNP